MTCPVCRGRVASDALMAVHYARHHAGLMAGDPTTVERSRRVRRHRLSLTKERSA